MKPVRSMVLRLSAVLVGVRVAALIGLLVAALVAIGSASPLRAQVTIRPAYPDLTFDTPVDIQVAPGDSSRLFVVEREGLIYVIEESAWRETREVFLDIRDRVHETVEEGLLGLAFHPDFAENRTFFVYYITPEPRHSVLSSFVAATPNQADPSSEQVLLEIEQPHPQHNAGQLQFGPDGYLYVAVGDGGGFGENRGTGEDLETLLGSILRIDVDATEGDALYGIPPDNPFAGDTTGRREEIYSYGFRNPWRFSFDREDFRAGEAGQEEPSDEPAEIWVGDVGGGSIEEVNLVERGRSHGWGVMEGDRCHPETPDCDKSERVMPLWYYWHGEDRVIIGGFVYRGEELPMLQGNYVFGDFLSGRIWALARDSAGVPHVDEVLHADSLRIFTFGEDNSGELYVGAMAPSGAGGVYRLASDVVNEGVGNSGVEDPSVPALATLNGNHPNPFRSETRISYTLRQPSPIDLSVYNALGRKVRTLLTGMQAPGSESVRWDGTDDSGQAVPAGVYFYRLTAGNRRFDSGHMVLVR